MAEPSPFDDEDESTASPQNETVLEWAIRVNPDEDWQRCCVCGSAGDELGGARKGLVKGLVLLGDMTLARCAWCWNLACCGERYSSTYIPAGMLKG